MKRPSLIIYTAQEDPTHRMAHAMVHAGLFDEARVEDENGYTLFRAWRITPTSYAWQTSIMAAPAFESSAVQPEPAAGPAPVAAPSIRPTLSARLLTGIVSLWYHHLA